MNNKKSGQEALGPEVKGAVIGGLLAQAGNYLAKAIFQHGAEVVKGHVAKTFEDRRGELHAYLRIGLGDKATANFKRRWMLRQLCQPRTYGDKKPYKKWDEIKFDRHLTKLFTALKDNKEARDKMFNYLGEIESDEEFDLELESLNHDVIAQAIGRIRGDLEEFAADPNNALSKLRRWANNLPGAKG